MEQREKDIQELCKQVLSLGANWSRENPNGTHDVSCPMCDASENIGNTFPGMSDLNHKANCGWLIAKDLSSKR